MGVCGSNIKHTKSKITKDTLRMESGMGAVPPVAVYKTHGPEHEVSIDIKKSQLGKFAITNEIEQNPKIQKNYDSNKERFYHGVSNELGITWKATSKDLRVLYDKSPQALRSLVFETEIPAVLKWDIWQLLVEDNQQKELLDEKKFHALVKAKNEKVDDIVKKDVPRTFNEKEFFVSDVENIKVGKEMLYKICKAVGTYFKNIGYTQGFNFLAAYCLEVSGAQELESLNFILKFLTHERFMFVGMYEDRFPLVYFINFVVHWKLGQADPQVAECIRQSELPDELWLHKWVMSIFIGYFPNYFCSRVLDLILSTDIFTLASFMVSFVTHPINRKEFIKSKSDFSGLAEYLCGVHNSQTTDWNELVEGMIQTTIKKHMLTAKEVIDLLEAFQKQGHPCLDRFQRYGAIFQRYLERSEAELEYNITVYSFNDIESARNSQRKIQKPEELGMPQRVQVNPHRHFTNDLEELEKINDRAKDVEEGVQGIGRMEQKYVDGVQIHDNVFFRKKVGPQTVVAYSN
jgi:Rab-GTPase-TBC domain